MTNMEDGDSACDGSHKAAMLAVHLVSQVLDEAYVIANAAIDSGQPWRNLSILKSFKSSKLGETDDDASLEASKGDCDVSENKAEMGASIVATSTPQKTAARDDCSDEADVSESIIIHGDNPFIGQGDEDIDSQTNELMKSTSMFINHLFDMSDVERIVICDDSEIIQSTSEANDLIVDAMNKIMESYVANNLIPLESFPLVPNVEIVEGAVVQELSRSDNSEYSFATEAFPADINRDVAFYIDNSSREKHEFVDMYEPTVVKEITEENSVQKVEETNECIQNRNDVTLYENAYAALNRDFDQNSEEDAYPVLQDPKAATLQEVELMTANTSNEELDSCELQKEQKFKEIDPTVSGASGSRKSTLARRCRIQGARLLACLRGWWRRKTPGKRKESRGHGTVLGMCPLSPDARRRASSLLDNRLLRSPSPSRPVTWKFNTVTEALVNSNRWKDYTFDPKPEFCGEASVF